MVLKHCCYGIDGVNVRVLEPDDGSGWVKVADQDGKSGLVPASYIQTAQGGSAYSHSGERGTPFFFFKHMISFAVLHVHITTTSAGNLFLSCSGSR
jgi:hypothetical protein